MVERKLDPEILKEAGISYYKDKDSPNTPPINEQRAERLKCHILQCRLDVVDAAQAIDNPGIQHSLTSDSHQFKMWFRAKKISQEIGKIDSNEEKQWEDITNIIFEPFDREAKDSHGRSRMGESAIGDGFDRYRILKNQIWSSGRKLLDPYCPLSEGYLKHPKPDFYFAFPILNQQDIDRHAINSENTIKNFSLDRLVKICDNHQALAGRIRHGEPDKNPLNSAPCVDLLKQSKRGLFQSHHLACYPWLVCEIKHASVVGKNREYVYCQAANATAVCLTMLANLGRQVGKQPEAKNIPPVTALTMVGSDVRAWVAYISAVRNGSCEYRMHCIWRGNLERPIDALYLCAMIQRIHVWAIHILRPWITLHIWYWLKKSLLRLPVRKPDALAESVRRLTDSVRQMSSKGRKKASLNTRPQRSRDAQALARLSSRKPPFATDFGRKKCINAWQRQITTSRSDDPKQMDRGLLCTSGARKDGGDERMVDPDQASHGNDGKNTCDEATLNNPSGRQPTYVEALGRY